MSDSTRFFIVVPFYNEEKGLGDTLFALANQTDPDFSLVLVDNASTDAGAAIGAAFARSSRAPRVHLVREPQKGTGAASDSGFRFAIRQGAKWIARTDADCLPQADWVQQLKVAMHDDGLEFVAGVIRPREDEWPLGRMRRLVLNGMVWIAEHHGRLHRKGPQFKYPYFMAAGNNMAITADLYERCGGFPRSAIEDTHEDRVLSETVRTLTARAAVRADIIVYNSVRRVRAYGYINTLRWYRNHGYRGGVVDVR